MTHQSTRRAFVGAIVAAPIVAVAGFAEAATVGGDSNDGSNTMNMHTSIAANTENSADLDAYTREDMDLSFANGKEIATYHMARAWVDRWTALGGNFGFIYNRDGLTEGVTRGMICGTDLWTDRTDRIHPKLEPHAWLIEDGHHEGAVKVLEGMLMLVPGLREAVREIAGSIALAATAWRA